MGVAGGQAWPLHPHRAGLRPQGMPCPQGRGTGLTALAGMGGNANKPGFAVSSCLTLCL